MRTALLFMVCIELLQTNINVTTNNIFDNSLLQTLLLSCFNMSQPPSTKKGESGNGFNGLIFTCGLNFGGPRTCYHTNKFPYAGHILPATPSHYNWATPLSEEGHEMWLKAVEPQNSHKFRIQAQNEPSSSLTYFVWMSTHFWPYDVSFFFYFWRSASGSHRFTVFFTDWDMSHFQGIKGDLSVIYLLNSSDSDWSLVKVTRRNVWTKKSSSWAKIQLHVHVQDSCPTRTTRSRGVCSAQNDKSASCLNSSWLLLAPPQVSGFSFKPGREPQREGWETLWRSSVTGTVEIIVKMKQYKLQEPLFGVVSLLTSMIGLLLFTVLMRNADSWGLRKEEFEGIRSFESFRAALKRRKPGWRVQRAHPYRLILEVCLSLLFSSLTLNFLANFFFCFLIISSSFCELHHCAAIVLERLCQVGVKFASTLIICVWVWPPPACSVCAVLTETFQKTLKNKKKYQREFKKKMQPASLILWF